MAWTKEVHHSRLQAKRETAAKKKYGELVSYGQNSGLAPAALVACVLFKVVPGEACGRFCHGIPGKEPSFTCPVVCSLAEEPAPD